MNHNKKVIAVIVTYNRKELLKECINALLKQDYNNCDILVVDNASTDGTKQFIADELKNSKVHYENTGANLGGAGGFNFGIRKACKLECDFIWVMDDDCIVNNDSLTELIKADEKLKGDYGFLSSIVLWKDGNAAEMNKQKIIRIWYKKAQYLKNGLLLTNHATFVSMFLKKEVILNVGLPIKEFFIWGDDVEYSNRISKIHNCYIVGKSQVLHKTTNNVGSNIAIDNAERTNRYKYAYRNEMYIARKNGFLGICRQFAKINLHIFRVIFKSKNAKLKKIWIIFKNSLAGLFFNPKIEYME